MNAAFNLLIGIDSRLFYSSLGSCADDATGCQNGLMRRLLLYIIAALACGGATPPPGAGWRTVGPGGGGTLFHPAVRRDLLNTDETMQILQAAVEAIQRRLR